MVFHSLLQWTTFWQNSPPWPVGLGWPHTAWLSFIELDKAVVHVIRLVSFLWLCFQSVCPLMPSLSAYCLTGASLTLDMRYLSTAAPAKHSCCPLPWTWGISSWSPLQTLDIGYLFWLLGTPALHSHGSLLQYHAAADIVTEYLKFSIPFSSLQHNSHGLYLPPQHLYTTQFYLPLTF